MFLPIPTRHLLESTEHYLIILLQALLAVYDINTVLKKTEHRIQIHEREKNDAKLAMAQVNQYS